VQGGTLEFELPFFDVDCDCAGSQGSLSLVGCRGACGCPLATLRERTRRTQACSCHGDPVRRNCVCVGKLAAQATDFRLSRECLFESASLILEAALPRGEAGGSLFTLGADPLHRLTARDLLSRALFLEAVDIDIEIAPDFRRPSQLQLLPQ
jgi:hypothetical protein